MDFSMAGREDPCWIRILYHVEGGEVGDGKKGSIGPGETKRHWGVYPGKIESP